MNGNKNKLYGMQKKSFLLRGRDGAGSESGANILWM